jgi:glycosyltransferase involved in cell wall biosynthesis
MKKVAYLIVQEDLASPIIQSQVINILKAIPKSESDRFLLVCFCRIDYYFKSNNNFEVRARLKADGIDTVFVPFLSWSFPIGVFSLPLVVPQLLIGLICIVMKHHFEILHCRSYNAGLLGAAMKTFFKIKVIFDPRSPYPEENIASGRWSKRSINFKLWKKTENWIAKKSDVIIAISQPFMDSFKNIAPNTKVVLIPNNYSVYNNEEDTEINGSVANVMEQSSVLKLCYIGSLGKWNDPDIYLNFIKRIMEAEDKLPVKAKFLVSPEGIIPLKKSIKLSELDQKLFEVKWVPPEKVMNEISGCTVGLQIMKYKDDRLSIKFVEYLAAGLPVIVSENVKGAAYIVKTYDVGFIINSDFINLSNVLDFINQVAENKLYWRNKCQSVAQKLFSTESISIKVFELYKQVSE